VKLLFEQKIILGYHDQDVKQVNIFSGWGPCLRAPVRDRPGIIEESHMNEITNEADQVIVRPGTDIVAPMADAFKADLLSAINSTGGAVVIDLEGVEMVDSVGIGVIIASHNTLNQAARKLKVMNVAENVYDLFITMGLNRRFVVQGVG
jgi:anti-anti-sigma factor